MTTHPTGATLHLGGDAWAMPSLEPLLVPIDTLVLYPGNPRRGDQEAITSSIRDHGLYAGVVTQTTTHHTLVGNHRLRSLLDLGATMAPSTPADVDDTRAAQIVARDNLTSDRGGYDDTEQLALLEALAAQDQLPGSGYTTDDLDALRAAAEPSAYLPPVVAPSLADRFVVPPFSVLDQRAGAWQDRKRRWLALGIQSEVGRGDSSPVHPVAPEFITERVADVAEGSDLWDRARAALREAVTAAGWKHRDLDAHLGTNGMAGHYLGRSQPMVPTAAQWLRLAEVLTLPADLLEPMTLEHTRAASQTATGRGPKTLGTVQTNLDGVDAARYGRSVKGQEGLTKIKPGLAGALAGNRTQAQLAAMLGQGANAYRDPTTGDLVYTETTAAGVSIFDPVLTELAYRWFSPTGGHVLDPFAGGSVRGIVASALGRSYTGVELREQQVEANEVQAQSIVPRLGQGDHPVPAWVTGDSREVLAAESEHDGVLAPADLVFSCPPYADLEVYSDDPADLSAMPYDQFLDAYRAIIEKACARLRDDRFAVWVIGEVRDRRGLYRNLVGDTTQAFLDAGLAYYNEAILVTPVGSLPIRAGRQFAAGRKLGKTHQNVLVFVKGDPRAAADACGTVDVTLPEVADTVEDQ